MNVTIHISSDCSTEIYQSVLDHFQSRGYTIRRLLPPGSTHEFGSLEVTSIDIKTMSEDTVAFVASLTSHGIIVVDHSEHQEKTFSANIRHNAHKKPLSHHGNRPNASIGSYFYANTMAKIYQLNTVPLPTTRVNIAIISLGGGFNPSDLSLYWGAENLGIIQPKVYSVSINGATNKPGVAADVENLLDIQVCGSVSPYSNIYVHFAPNSAQGFYNAIYAAVNNTTTPFKVISISWGAPEKYWSASYLSAMNNLFATAAAKGITVCVASGDNGSSDGITGLNVDFPSSSPYVLACGGTSLSCPSNVYSSTTKETVWGAANTVTGTGGGYSNVFAKPSYQNTISTLQSISKRAVPDVAGNADPKTGWIIAYQGQLYAVGGTSAVAPMWAGYLSRLELTKAVTPLLYSIYPSVLLGFRDTTTGTNGAYNASLGWDPCTGMGSPNGKVLSPILLKYAR